MEHNLGPDLQTAERRHRAPPGAGDVTCAPASLVGNLPRLAGSLLPMMVRDIARSFYQGDAQPLLDHVSDDCLVIGTAADTARGKDELAALVRDRSEQPTFVMRDASFDAIATSAPGEAIVVGFYTIFSDTSSHALLSKRQRVTVSCRRVDGRWQARLIHCSSEWEPLDGDQEFHGKVSAQTYRYVRDIIRATKLQASAEDPVAIPRGSASVFIDPTTLIYAEARARETVLYFLDHTTTVKMLLANVCKLLPRQLVRVHRSYAVNRFHVATIEKGRLLLTTGQDIPIPRRKQLEVERALVHGGAAHDQVIA